MPSPLVTPFGPIPASGNLLCILGPPGAGKTTISMRLADNTGAKLLVMSRFLRSLAEQDPDAPIAKYIQDNFNSGSNIDNNDIHMLVAAELDSMDEGTIILDGFPRTENARNCLTKWLERTGRKLIVLHVFADIETCRQRFQSKNLNHHAEQAFNARADHYATIERGLISALSGWPVININTNG